MGSTFVSIDPNKTDSKRIFGNTKPQPVWLQFVPGIVGGVVTSEESWANSSDTGIPEGRLLNSILAKPHVGHKIKKTSMLDDEDRYFPLFRGIVDVPMVGDPVLLCTLGGINYYLGPLNTDGKVDFNKDNLESSDILGDFSDIKVSREDMEGTSKNWRGNDSVVHRLQKKSNIELDDPDNERTQIKHTGNLISEKMLADIHGDLMLEGRHGNSIRIGSRNINPYIIISNTNYKSVEGLTVGSTVALLDRGSIQQHFRDVKDFVLASDNPAIDNSHRRIGGDLYNYGYGKEKKRTENQVFVNSDRITINARTNSIFLSAFKDVIIGTGNDFTLKTKRLCMIDAGNVIIGSTESVNEPMVLGLKLVEVLGDIIKAIGQLQVGATVGGISAPVQGSGSPGWIELNTVISTKLTQVLSSFHFIEDNDAQK